MRGEDACGGGLVEGAANAAFDVIGYAEWKNLVEKELKGAPFDRKLVRDTPEGIALQPLYTVENCRTVSRSFIRKEPGWEICEMISGDSQPSEGVDAVWVQPNVALSGKFSSSCAVYCLCPIESVAGGAPVLPLKGAVAVDLFSSYPSDRYGELASFVRRADEISPALRTVGLNIIPLCDAGATAVQELGFMLASSVSCLRGLEASGVSPDLSAEKMIAIFATGPHFFMELAKFRAARILHAALLKECGVSDSLWNLHILARTALWNKSRLDPHVYMLRAVTETLSMVLGGCDSVVTGPFDEALGGSGEFSRRTAKNVQILLKEESHLNEVLDAGGGSHFLETLTSDLCESAWAYFQEIERNGGLVEAVLGGVIQEHVKAAAGRRMKDVSRRKDVLVGTSMYVNVHESLEWKPESVETRNIVEPFRAGEAYEALRLAAESFRKKYGHLPRAFLINMGSVSQHRARADFSRSFLEPAGFEVVCPDGFEDPDSAVRAAEDSGACLCVICSTDEAYPDLVPAIAGLLKQRSPASYLVVAGYPEAHIEAFRAAGVDDFLHIRSDNLSLLRSFHQKTGVAR